MGITVIEQDQGSGAGTGAYATLSPSQAPLHTDSMRLVFLGTSSGQPVPERNVTSQALQFDDGAIWLLDCGEATQHRIQAAGLRPSRIDRILITHLHGDHCFGLPGVLAACAIQGRDERPIRILGPSGLRAWIELTLQTSATVLPFPLEITELSAPMDLVPDPALRGSHGWLIQARPLRHRVPCFGYSLRGPHRHGRFDAARAEALGIAQGPLRGVLQAGGPIELPDGRLIQPGDVMAPPRPALHLVLLGDTCGSEEMAAQAQGCDLLVHEATYDEARLGMALQWGHSTTGMAGRFAAEVGAKTLILTHFSSRFTTGDHERSVADLVEECRAYCPGTEVLAADDLWSFTIPP